MALTHNPSIVTSGLAFACDFLNRKSYQGPSIQNKMNSISPLTTSGTGYSFVGGSEIVDIPSVGPTLVQYSNIQNNYSSVSSWCCPNPFSYYGGGNISVSGSTQYTYAILYKCESGYTHPNYMYRYEYNASSTYLTEAGIHNDSNRIHLGNGWYWAWATFTTQATASYLNVFSFYYRYSTSYDKLSVAKILLAQGDYTTLHPKYWPDVGVTRSSTQSILDLAKNTQVTSTVPHSSNIGEFDGTGKLISFTAPALSSNTLEFIFYNTNGTDTYPTIYNQVGQQGTTGFHWLYFNNTGTTLNMQYANGSTTVTVSFSGLCPANTYVHVTLVSDMAAQTVTCYSNGVSLGTTSATGIKSIASSTGYIGTYQGDAVSSSYRLKGRLPMFKIYDKALSATEVSQNFNAIRGKYGL